MNSNVQRSRRIKRDLNGGFTLPPGSWYVNVLAVRPQYRSMGLGSRLLAVADELGSAAGKRAMSVIVSDANAGARRLYERCSYSEVSSRAMVKEGWENDGENWVLLTKSLPKA